MGQSQLSMSHHQKTLIFMNPVEFDKWLTRRFERFKLASGLNEKSEETQVNTLVYCMGKQADDVFQSFSLSLDQMKNYNTVKNKFKSHFVISKNTIFERAKFNTRRQEDDESADSFITLYTLCQSTVNMQDYEKNLLETGLLLVYEMKNCRRNYSLIQS